MISSENMTTACDALPMLTTVAGPSALDNVRIWVNGTWFNDYSVVSAKTGLNSTQLDAFYGDNTSTGFTTLLNQVVSDQRAKAFPNSLANSTDNDGIMTAGAQFT